MSLDDDASIIVALGGNLAQAGKDTRAVLFCALAAFPAEGLDVRRASRFWRSAAWPDPSEPPFLNAVVEVRTELDPESVLAALHALEARFGRERGRANAPRTLDLDLIAYGRDVRESTPVLPHPRAADRRFVMGPLAEILPGWRHPLLGLTACELARFAYVGADATPLEG